MDEIRTMDIAQLEERRAALAEEIGNATAARLEEINAELDAIATRKAEIRAEAEERAKTVEEVINLPAEPTPIITEERTHKMTDREFRSSQEYIDMYVEYVKNGYDMSKIEKRMPEVGGGGEALITSATLPLPTYVEDKINAAWNSHDLLRRVRRTFFAGNVEVGVEVESDGAYLHTEGDIAVPAENLEIEFISLIPQYVKKMVRVTHTAVLGLNGTAFLDYLVEEIESKIFDKLEAEILQAVGSSNFAVVQTAAGATVTTADIITATGDLAPNARPVIVIDRATAAALKATALSANYGYDPFDGMEVIYAALGGNVILLDPNAVQVNFPEGDAPKFIFDEYTEAPANVVRIIGRLAAAWALVETGAAVVIEPGE